MNRSIALLLTLVLLAHSLAGCCSHHAHAAGSEVADQCCETHEHGHEHDGDANREGDHGDPSKHCDEGSCTFLREAASTVDFGLLFAQCSAILAEHKAEPSLNFAEVPRFDAETVGPPTRLHLFHQILLI